MKRTEVIVLAAGKGTRMHSDAPKVLQTLGGLSLIDHVLGSVRALQPSRIHVVYGYGGGAVKDVTEGDDLNWVEQTEQLGTGHAVSQAIPFVDQDSDVLVVYGDVPLVGADTMNRLIGASKSRCLALLTAVLPDPVGYGRVVRSSDGNVAEIVEEVDATDEQKTICEINVGFLSSPAKLLSDWLRRIDDVNSQREHYLTDIVGLVVADGGCVVACRTADAVEAVGVNSVAELADAERAFQNRQAYLLMDNGLTLRDPNRFDLRGSLTFGPGAAIDVNTIIEGRVQLGSRVTIGPNCYVRDCTIGDDTVVEANCVLDGATIGLSCMIGPFARLRPQTELGDGTRVGNFVEIKKSRIGSGTKANHLAYLGDAEVGSNVNIGAGVITCNYDGTYKHKTTIENDAFIGSDTQLIAPVTIGRGATIGAGSTIRRDAPPEKLTLTTEETKTLGRWRPSKKSETE